MIIFFIRKINILIETGRKIDAKRHLTEDYVHPIYKLLSIKNSSKEEE